MLCLQAGIDEPVLGIEIHNKAGCDIKGNVGKARIYYVPNHPIYKRVKINKSGERWFCSEVEAKAAGWRAPKSRALKRPQKDAKDCLVPKNIENPGCDIKGNTGPSGNIYHLRCSDFYFETKINVSEGDRWFCSESEAKKAGWSKAGQIWSKVNGATPRDCLVPKDKHPPGCDIKGNISNSGKIYHIRCSAFYYETKIRLKKGERWFCSVADAEAAGWRAPRNNQAPASNLVNIPSR